MSDEEVPTGANKQPRGQRRCTHGGEKQIIAELKTSGIDSTEAERTLAKLSYCLRVFEKQWLAILEKTRTTHRHMADKTLEHSALGRRATRAPLGGYLGSDTIPRAR